jgi:hypothetical protein
MPDVFTQIADADPALLDGIIAGLEPRAADRRQRTMLKAYRQEVAIPLKPTLLPCTRDGAGTANRRVPRCIRYGKLGGGAHVIKENTVGDRQRA